MIRIIGLMLIAGLLFATPIFFEMCNYLWR